MEFVLITTSSTTNSSTANEHLSNAVPILPHSIPTATASISWMQRPQMVQRIFEIRILWS